MGDQDYMFLPQVMKLVKEHTTSMLQIIENGTAAYSNGAMVPAWEILYAWLIKKLTLL